MAFDEQLAQRIQLVLKGRRGVTTKKMFGGIAFMVNGNMSVGIVGDELMLRVGAEKAEELLKLDHVKEMDFTGKPLKGFVYVEPEGFETDPELEKWVMCGVEYAKSLPKK